MMLTAYLFYSFFGYLIDPGPPLFSKSFNNERSKRTPIALLKSKITKAIRTGKD